MFVLFIFMWKIILMKGAFLFGDYSNQFYPWSQYFSETIKHLQFPFWCRFFGSGFPIMAEGQVGGFYPINILFFYLLPFRVAYNYIVVFHFVLAGLFMYLYSRKIGASSWGGVVASIVFCFGSSYAGCFYNTVTVKTLVWVPLVLLLFEEYFNSKRMKFLLFSGVILGLQLLAGFVQMAVYSIGFYIIYFIYGLYLRKDLRIKDFINAFIAMGIASIIFLPQGLITLQMVNESSRSGASLGFALWGSFSPLNFITTVFPYWIFSGTRIYLGVLTLLFIITSFYVGRSNNRIKPLFLWMFVSFFLALGKYNPLYVLGIKFFNLHSLRNPSKFLFFALFSAAVLAGYGFTKFFEEKNHGLRKKACTAFSYFIATIVGIFFAGKMILSVFSGKIVEVGKWYVQNYIYGQAHHRYDLDSYIERVEGFYQTFLERSSLTNPYILLALILCVFSVVLCMAFTRRKHITNLTKSLIIAAIVMDLYVYSFYGTGFRGNILDYSYLEPEAPEIYQIIREDKSLFRVLPYGLNEENLPNWIKPNLNTVYGIDSVGAYSPLVSDKYRTTLQDFEVVDNSLGLISPQEGSISANLQLVKGLNVKYIVTNKEIYEEDVTFIEEESNIFLYRLENSLQRGFIVKNLENTYELIDSETNIVKYTSGEAEFLIDSEGGYFVFSEFNYPGWTCYLDERKVEIYPFLDILMAIECPEGKHKVRFIYEPYK